MIKSKEKKKNLFLFFLKRTKKTSKEDENKTTKPTDDDLLNESIDFLPLDDVEEEAEDKIDLPFLETSKNGLFKPKIIFPSNLGYEDHKTRESTNFKLNSCSIHASGALLLQDSDKTLLGQSFTSMNTTFTNRFNNNITMNQSNLRVVNNGFGSDSDDENEKQDPFLPSKNATLQLTPTKNTSSNSNKTIISNQTNGEEEEKIEQKRKPKRKQKQKEFQDIEGENFDIWEPLDPHEESIKGKKPFKKSMIF